MSLKVLKHFHQLDKKDFRVLSVIERLMINHKYPPIEELTQLTGFSITLVNTRLNKLNRMQLITFWRQGPYDGVELQFNAYDALSLRALAQKDIVTGIGGPLGVGKEADVILGDSPTGKVAVKIHRLGKHDFRDTRRKRGYIADKRHVSRLYESRLSANHEFKAISKLREAGVSVPVPRGQNRHVVVMDLIEGFDLQKVRFLAPDDYIEIYRQTITSVREAYKLGIIHADLSEYNIMLTEDCEPIIIDWPQWIPVSHENAKEILKRDLDNLTVFFGKRGVPSEEFEKTYELLEVSLD
ncbi:MAG: RIO1 family regulatory kinase/ATPase domain-containing protein [Candidatus Hodarchaeales archaeon]|jgi:RIO kinase 2